MPGSGSFRYRVAVTGDIESQSSHDNAGGRNSALRKSITSHQQIKTKIMRSIQHFRQPNKSVCAFLGSLPSFDDTSEPYNSICDCGSSVSNTNLPAPGKSRIEQKFRTHWMLQQCKNSMLRLRKRVNVIRCNRARVVFFLGLSFTIVDFLCGFRLAVHFLLC